MPNHEERAARALASWLREGRDEKQLERAIVEQLEETLYWERYQLSERIDGLLDRYIGASDLPLEARNAALELIGEMKAMLRGRQHRDDLRERLMPDWRTDGGARVALPDLNRDKRPWPGPALPPGERNRESRLWESANEVRDAPGTYSSRAGGKQP